MKNYTFRFVVSVLLLLITSIGVFGQAPINIVSGIKGEVYDQFAHDIQNNTHVNLNIYETQGSRDNLNFLFSDSIQIAFVQYDVLKFIAKAKPEIEQNIKVFLPLYSEEVHLITLRTSGIESLKDLNGKRIGVGGLNSGTYVTCSIIQNVTNIKWKAINIDFNQSVTALLEDSLDAFFYVGAAPSSYLSSLKSSIAGKLKLVDVQNDKLEGLYGDKIIEKGQYSWNHDDVETIGVQSLLMVNVNNIDTTSARQIDVLYSDLSDNLKGIQWNKFSHPKWLQVDFGNMDNINWPVYNQKYVSYEMVVNIMAVIAAILSFIQIYFIINKLWKRKHERVVAESISISAMFISIFINGFFAVKNMGGGNLPQLSANIMWITASVISTIIGVGLYVASNRSLGFFRLLLRALNMERQEAGDLAKVFFKPSGAGKIIEILDRVAMVDNDLDNKERDFIQGFADDWGIDMNWDGVKKYVNEKESRFIELRSAMNSYLATSPPKEQASQLIDVISLLVNVDEVVTEEEDLMLAELTGLIMKYLGKGSEIDVFKVAVVPQNENQKTSIEELSKDLTKEFIAGSWVYISEAYYSERYAEIISAQYRALNVFSVVFKPNNMDDVENFVKEKNMLNEE